MSPPLSYPGLKCVLEFLDTKKRIHLTSRSRSLRKIDNSIPFRAKILFIWENCLLLDDIVFQTDLERSADTDKEVIERLKKEEANGKEMIAFLIRRFNIHVDEVTFFDVKSLHRCPVGKLDLIVNKISNSGSDFEEFLPMIDKRSFPLAEFSCLVKDPINHPIVHSAKHLDFMMCQCHTKFPGVEKLPNKSAVFRHHGLNSGDILEIIKYWMKHGKDVGTEFLFGYWKKQSESLKIMIKLLVEQFPQYQNNLEGVSEKFLPEQPRFLIPIDSTKRIQVFGKVPPKRYYDPQQLVLRVV
ncbi:hypothetical protein CRE_17878 [Caenorhabditis remanei]|uniref:F-box domain-containing protein n=1 Tax=Caenorhabditis remanei TaxID=31234 RepID=E3MDC7_CAERE|nr:hypothetical protein CRE_17878 [Caenorhabditis remanei]